MVNDIVSNRLKFFLSTRVTFFFIYRLYNFSKSFLYFWSHANTDCIFKNAFSNKCRRLITQWTYYAIFHLCSYELHLL